MTQLTDAHMPFQAPMRFMTHCRICVVSCVAMNFIFNGSALLLSVVVFSYSLTTYLTARIKSKKKRRKIIVLKTLPLYAT